jgi:hypothetical protein
VIDFRYHLVSIVAVFLALAIGIVIGSTSVLKGAVLSGLQKTSAAEKSRIDSLYAQNGQLKQQLNAAESFASASEHVLLDGLLDGQRVVLVEAPGASGSVISGVQNALTTAGATVTGQVQFQTQFFSTAAESNLDTLNRQLTPAGVTLHGGTPQADAGELIASAILTKDSVDHPLTGSAETADQTIISGYAAQGYLSTNPKPTDRATLAVVIIPASPPTTSDANIASQTLVTLAQQLNLADSGTVVAGQVTGSGAGSAIDVMRAGGRGGHLSSVDNADTPNGQIVVAQALYEQLAKGTSGSYGSLPGATQPGPSPAPVPSATPSTATTSSSRATTTQPPVAGK